MLCVLMPKSRLLINKYGNFGIKINIRNDFMENEIKGILSRRSIMAF